MFDDSLRSLPNAAKIVYCKECDKAVLLERHIWEYEIRAEKKFEEA